MNMDREVLEKYGNQLLDLKLFPFFDMAHYILACLMVRKDINQHQKCNLDIYFQFRRLNLKIR